MGEQQRAIEAEFRAGEVRIDDGGDGRHVDVREARHVRHARHVLDDGRDGLEAEGAGAGPAGGGVEGERVEKAPGLWGGRRQLAADEGDAEEAVVLDEVARDARAAVVGLEANFDAGKVLPLEGLLAGNACAVEGSSTKPEVKEGPLAVARDTVPGDEVGLAAHLDGVVFGEAGVDRQCLAVADVLGKSGELGAEAAVDGGEGYPVGEVRRRLRRAGVVDPQGDTEDEEAAQRQADGPPSALRGRHAALHDEDQRQAHQDDADDGERDHTAQPGHFVAERPRQQRQRQRHQRQPDDLAARFDRHSERLVSLADDIRHLAGQLIVQAVAVDRGRLDLAAFDFDEQPTIAEVFDLAAEGDDDLAAPATPERQAVGVELGLELAGELVVRVAVDEQREPARRRRPARGPAVLAVLAVLALERGPARPDAAARLLGRRVVFQDGQQREVFLDGGLGGRLRLRVPGGEDDLAQGAAHGLAHHLFGQAQLPRAIWTRDVYLHGWPSRPPDDRCYRCYRVGRRA